MLTTSVTDLSQVNPAECSGSLTSGSTVVETDVVNGLVSVYMQ